MEANVASLSETYGELDGEIVYLYATAFAEVSHSLTPEQQQVLMDYRQHEDHLNLNTSFGDPCSLSPETSACLYSDAIAMPAVENTDFLFGL